MLSASVVEVISALLLDVSAVEAGVACDAAVSLRKSFVLCPNKVDIIFSLLILSFRSKKEKNEKMRKPGNSAEILGLFVVGRVLHTYVRLIYLTIVVDYVCTSRRVLPIKSSLAGCTAPACETARDALRTLP